MNKKKTDKRRIRNEKKIKLFLKKKEDDQTISNPINK